MLYNILAQVLPISGKVNAGGFVNAEPVELDDATSGRDAIERNISNLTFLVLYGDGKSEYVSGYRMAVPAEIVIPGDVLKQSIVNFFIVEAQ